MAPASRSAPPADAPSLRPGAEPGGRADDDHGRSAEAPRELPAAGWRDVAARVRQEVKDDNLVLIAAGVAFFGLLSLVPALVAAVSVYGLVASPAQITEHLDALRGAVPDQVHQLLDEQLRRIAETSSGQLGVQVAVGVVLALWAASSAMKHLIVALSTVYDERETRGFVRLRATAAVVTVAGLAFVLVTLALLAGGPTWLEANVHDGLGQVVRILRWPLLGVLMALALAVLYRRLPDRDPPRWRWVSWGAVLATVAWLAGSVAFSVYVGRFAGYDRTYGSLAGVVVTLLWLFLTALCVLVGAEVNAEVEHQTARDSTEGAPRPLGRRGAEVADSVGPSADAVAADLEHRSARRP